jgi:hypothetical protein
VVEGREEQGQGLHSVPAYQRGTRETCRTIQPIPWRGENGHRRGRRDLVPERDLHSRLIHVPSSGHAVQRRYISVAPFAMATVLLAFLTSPTRCLEVEEIAGSIASISIYWTSAPRQQELRKLVYSILDSRKTTWTPHDNLFVLHNGCVGGFGDIECGAFSIRPGEGNHFLTDRWRGGVHQYYHNTPSHSHKRSWDASTNTSTRISKLSAEIMLLILD